VYEAAAPAPEIAAPTEAPVETETTGAPAAPAPDDAPEEEGAGSTTTQP